MRQLLVNKIQCPDGTIIQSKHQHDFVQHTQEDGREYAVDGGLVYQRILFADKEYKDLSVYADDPHETIREHFTWTSTMDKNKKPLKTPVVKKLKELDDDHVETLCYFTLRGYPSFINQVFVDEHNYRLEQCTPSSNG